MNSATLYIDKYRCQIVVAETDFEQQKGLMYRDIPIGMAFPYKWAGRQMFWMKNVKFPLDIVFCYNNRITQIHKGEPHNLTLIGDNTLSDLVIELPFGTCAELGITIGDPVRIVHNDNQPKHFERVSAPFTSRR